ncbi:hypothetical protein PR048_014023 [Dryococelus australis]|uniref:DDE-1 domain-containing protein n=1 Tax=Dryococelus australis TaxID=614101 RepID=A0ABQ9HTT3_9NEOP|nr:hypothetical protein PR048_014023 [Dryococelus australis]
MSIYKAAKAHNVPESTTRNHIKKKTANKVKGSQRNQLIPKYIEDELASHITFFSDIQQPLSRSEILPEVEDNFSVNKLENRFSYEKSGPGGEWLMHFLKRYPEIKDRKAEPLQKAHAQLSANGHVPPPPCIIYKSKYLYDIWCLNGTEGAAYLVEWTKDWQKPILVTYDGHNSHIQLSISKVTIKNNIHILSLPAHSSDKIQPLDVAIFGPAKEVWMKVKNNIAEDHHKNQ